MTAQEIQDKISIAQAEKTEAETKMASAAATLADQQRYYNGCSTTYPHNAKKRSDCQNRWSADMGPYQGVYNTQKGIATDRANLLVTLNKQLSDASEAEKNVRTTLANQGKTIESVATAAQADAVVTVEKGAAEIKNTNKVKNVKLILGFSAGAIVLVVAVILIIRKLRKKKQQ